MLTVQETAALLRTFDNILILTHVRPDGDTVGCAAALCASLRALGKTAWLLPNPELTDTTAQTHAVAAALLRTGIDYQTVNKVFFRTKTRKRMQLEGAMLSACEFYDRDRVAVLSVPLSLMERFQATESDAEDLSALGGQIEGVDCAVTMRELRPNVWKLSVRTGARINATDVCRLLGGGGHAAAAGATVEAPWPEAKRRILEAIAKNAPDFE